MNSERREHLERILADLHKIGHTDYVIYQEDGQMFIGWRP